MATMDAMTEQRLKILAESDPVTAECLRAARADAAGIGHAAAPADAETEAKVAAWLARETPDLIIVPGLGDGRETRALLAALPETASVLLIERDPVRLARLFSVCPLETLVKDKRMKLVPNADPDAIEMAMSALLILPRKPVIGIFDLPSVAPADADDYRTVLLAVRNRMRVAILNVGTLAYLGPLWQYNTFKNLPMIVKSPGVHRLRDVFPGRPAVVAAAGPSLTEALPFLKAQRRRFLLIAVGTALRPLMHAGLVPDLVVSVDAKSQTGHQFTVDCRDLYLVASMIAYPPVLRKFKGVFIARGSANYVGQWTETFLEPVGMLNAGGTVTVSALDMAVMLGCAPILSVGLDLCMSAQGTSHADHSMYHGRRMSAATSQPLIPVPGNTRETVMTKIDFRSYIDIIGEYVLDHPDRRFVNANNDGARINGMERVAPDRIGDFLGGEFEARSTLASVHDAFCPPAREPCLDAISTAADSLSEAMELATRAAMICNRLTAMLRMPGANDDARARAWLTEIEAIDNRIMVERDSSLLTDMALRRVFYGMEAKTSAHEEAWSEGVRANRRSRRLYEAVAKISLLTRTLLCEAAAAIGSDSDSDLIDFERSPMACDLHSTT